MEVEFNIKIPMFGKNKYPMCQFKDSDYELEALHSLIRHKTWKEFTPLKRVAAVNWIPTFLDVSYHYSNTDGD